MIIEGTIKQIGSSETNRASEWGFIRTIEFYEDIPELRNVSCPLYLNEKLSGCLGDKVRLSMYGNAIVGVKTSTKTYFEKPGFKIFLNSKTPMGAACFVFGSVILTFFTWGIGAIIPYMSYRNNLKKIKKEMKDDLSISL